MRPNYAEVPLLDGPRTAALHRYLEGGLGQPTPTAESCKLAVLFVHGNDGCHKQVRSIASVTLSSSQPNGAHVHFYTLEVEAVFTGFDGADLTEQARHVGRAVRTLQRLYEGTPAQLVVLAHSMGGLAALHAVGPLAAETAAAAGTLFPSDALRSEGKRVPKKDGR